MFAIALCQGGGVYWISQILLVVQCLPMRSRKVLTTSVVFFARLALNAVHGWSCMVLPSYIWSTLRKLLLFFWSSSVPKCYGFPAVVLLFLPLACADSLLLPRRYRSLQVSLVCVSAIYITILMMRCSRLYFSHSARLVFAMWSLLLLLEPALFSIPGDIAPMVYCGFWSYDSWKRILFIEMCQY